MKFFRKLAASATDIALILGGVLISLGGWMMYPPLGMISAGVMLILGGLLNAQDPKGGGKA